MTTFYPFSSGTYSLGASISSTQNTILLSSFVEPITGTPYTMSLLNTSISYGTIAPKTSQTEFISFTGINQNVNGTATLTGVVRGLARKYPFTSDSSYKLPHSGQSVFIISNPPQLYEEYVSLHNAESIDGVKTFTVSPIVPTGGTGTQAANNQDIANAITGSVGTATDTTFGTVKLSVPASSVPNPIVVGTNDPRFNTESGVALSSYNKVEDVYDTSNASLYTASTIAFVASSKTITDSANDFVTANFRPGTSIVVSGTVSNNGTYTIVSVAVGAIVVAETLVNESAGSSFTLTSVTIDKLARFDSTGKLPINTVPPIIAGATVMTLPTGENITANDAIAEIDTYQQLGAITLDNKTIQTASSYSFTVGNNTNRLLLVAVSVSGNTGSVSVSNVSYNGVNLTNIGSSVVSNNGYSHSQTMYLFKMIAPPVGTFTLAITKTGTLNFSSVHSYYNVEQTTGVDVITTSTTPSFSPFTLTTTSSEQNCVIFGAFAAPLGIGISGSQAVAFNGVSSSNFQLIATSNFSGDSGVIRQPSAVLGSYSATVSGSSSDNLNIGIQCSIKPSSPSSVVAVKSDATDIYKTNFIGFAIANATKDSNLDINIGNQETGLSGLFPLLSYYLSDTPGAIQSGPGTISKRIGIARSTTVLQVELGQTLGNWGSLTFGTVYRAPSDGFVVGYDSSNNTLTVYTDGSTSPTTVRQVSAGTGSNSFCCPIRAGDYYKVTTSGSGIGFWLPLS